MSNNTDKDNQDKQDNEDKYRIMINLIPIYLLREPLISIYDFVKK